jgi:hypothetical protein
MWPLWQDIRPLRLCAANVLALPESRSSFGCRTRMSKFGFWALMARDVGNSSFSKDFGSAALPIMEGLAGRRTKGTGE